jgi:hypothetical protein
MIINKEISLIQNDIRYTAELAVETNIVQLNTTFGNFIKYGKFYFLVLKEIRLELEKIDTFILLNGSRIDVHPSGMSLTSTKAYANVMGKQSGLENLVNIFDDCLDLSLIATVREQEVYHSKWLVSLQKNKDD